MREIKFRAKNVMNGEWEYGDLVHYNHSHTHISIAEKECKEQYFVHPQTIGQFIGLQDSKGNDIYEGDIIRAYGSKGDEIKHTVEYSDKEAMFCTKLIGAEMLGGSITQRWLNEFEFEIIGNIHDNPELLEAQK